MNLSILIDAGVPVTLAEPAQNIQGDSQLNQYGTFEQ